MNIVNAVATSTKDKLSLRGGLGFEGFFFHSEKILIDNGLIIADYHYFIFCSTYKSSG